MSPPAVTPATARELIREVTKSNLAAYVEGTSTFKVRPDFNGQGRDVHSDFVVLWKKPFAVSVDQLWGTHRGCIRYHESRGFYATLFWGHYDMDEKQGRSDFEARSRSIG